MGETPSKQELQIEESVIPLPTLVKSYRLQKNQFPTQKLVTETDVLHLLHPHKRFLYNLACPPGCLHSGTLHVSRFKAIPLPPKIGNISKNRNTQFFMKEDTFQYKGTENPKRFDWWVNFADTELFVAFHGPLFAQDEIQVAEHPSLAHLLVHLRKSEDDMDTPFVIPKTRFDGRPTPILIRGIERRCVVQLDANPEEGRPKGLYGNQFSSTPLPVIQKATKKITPPTITNLLCMAALGNGTGSYTSQQILDLFTTAYTSFKATRVDSIMALGGKDWGECDPVVVVHTGNWGTGAFGGSKPLMALLQCAAAWCAGVDQLVYHTFNEEGSRGYQMGYKTFLELVGEEEMGIETFLERVLRLDYKWGVGDGN